MSLLISKDLLFSYSRRDSLINTEAHQIIPEDLDDLKKLLTDDTYTTFGEDIDLRELLEVSIPSLCVENSDEQIVAAIYLNDHPNVPSIPPWEWTHWLYVIYQLEHITPINSRWIHLVLFDKKYIYTFMQPLLKTVFTLNTKLDYVIMVLPPGVTNLGWLEDCGTRILPAGFSEPSKVQTLFLMVRQHFVARFKIRRAVEEDNDDLVPLIHTNSQRLVEHYGEFYIAEILTRHPDAGRQLIVAEHDEHAVAVLCLNGAVNVELLTKSFELIPYYGLKKPDERDTFPEAGVGGVGSDITVVSHTHLVQSLVLSGSDIFTTHSSVTEEEEQREEASEDDYTIVNVSSIHLLFSDTDIPRSVETYDNDSGRDYSAVILSFNDYETHLLDSRKGLEGLNFDDLEQHYFKKTTQKGQLEDRIIFYGELNAFALELAVANLDYEIEAFHLLLEAAFECFPDRDYCVLSLPSTCPPTPLLSHFVKVPHKPISSAAHELYILHRNAILSHISVRMFNCLDFHPIERLIQNMDKTRRGLNEILVAITEVNQFKSYVLLSEKQIVGVAVIKEEEDYAYLKSHYDVEKWLNDEFHKAGSYGLIEYLIVSPIFQKHCRFFLREIHRLSDYSVLFHSIYSTSSALCCSICELKTVAPRPTVQIDQNDLEGCEQDYAVYQTNLPFSLYMSTPRHMEFEKLEINRNIVIVGSSNTAMAFLEGLFTSNDMDTMIFNNIAIVSPHGISYLQGENKIRDMMFVTKSFYNSHFMQMVCKKTYINVVNGVMTGIDRRNKLLIINEFKYLSYDYLFLMCGEQFQKPAASLMPKNNSPMDFPDNVFLINTELDASNALSQLKEMIKIEKFKSSIVVYGNSLEAYCCLAALLEFGIPAKHLVFVEPFPEIVAKAQHRISVFNDGEIDEAVLGEIINLGIEVYQSYYFTSWEYDEDMAQITAINIESCHKQVSIKCLAMFMYNDKTVSARTFLAFNRAGLVFDGALVIQPDCRTNDPNIYAAGTITKYSRRFYADHLAHKYYNLIEIGKKLGSAMRKKLTPFVGCGEEDDSPPISCPKPDMLVPIYEKPLLTYGRLPGGLRYLLVSKPGKKVPLETAMNSDNYGQCLITGNNKKLEKQGYFKLHINEHGTVETITCLAKFDLDVRSLYKLWGKHEKLLNNLMLRFQMHLIKDLFKFFKEPWACALYYDRFTKFEEEINDMLLHFTFTPGNSLIEDLTKLYKANDFTKLTDEQNEVLQEKFMKSPYHAVLEKKLLEFIRDNESFLSMYAHPTKVRYLLQGTESSPLFEPQ